MSLERAETDVTAEEMEVIARGFGVSGTRLGRLKGLARTASAHPFPEGLDRRIGDAYEQLLTESNRSVASWRGLFTEAPSLLLAPQLLNNLVLRHREQGAMTDEARAVADDYAFIQSERRRNLEALAASGKPVTLLFSSSSLDRQLIGSPSDVRYAFDNLQRLHDAGARVRVATAYELGAREAFEVAFRGSRTLPGWYADGYPGHSNGHAIRRSRLRSVEETSLSHDESAHLIASLDKAVTRRAIKARSTMTRDAEVVGPERDHATAMQLEKMLLSVARDRFAVVDPTSVDAGWNPDQAVAEKTLIRRIQHLRFDGPNAAWFANQMRNDPGFAAHTLRIANLVPAYADALETNHVAGPLLFDRRDEIAAELDRRRKEITFDGMVAELRRRHERELAANHFRVSQRDDRTRVDELVDPVTSQRWEVLETHRRDTDSSLPFGWNGLQEFGVACSQAHQIVIHCEESLHPMLMTTPQIEKLCRGDSSAAETVQTQLKQIEEARQKRKIPLTAFVSKKLISGMPRAERDAMFLAWERLQPVRTQLIVTEPTTGRKTDVVRKNRAVVFTDAEGRAIQFDGSTLDHIGHMSARPETMTINEALHASGDRSQTVLPYGFGEIQRALGFVTTERILASPAVPHRPPANLMRDRSPGLELRPPGRD